jgi:hypothetical protein
MSFVVGHCWGWPVDRQSQPIKPPRFSWLRLPCNFDWNYINSNYYFYYYYYYYYYYYFMKLIDMMSMVTNEYSTWTTINCYEILINMLLQDPATQAVKQCTVNPKKKKREKFWPHMDYLEVSAGVKICQFNFFFWFFFSNSPARINFLILRIIF